MFFARSSIRLVVVGRPREPGLFIQSSAGSGKGHHQTVFRSCPVRAMTSSHSSRAGGAPAGRRDCDPPPCTMAMVPSRTLAAIFSNEVFFRTRLRLLRPVGSTRSSIRGFFVISFDFHLRGPRLQPKCARGFIHLNPSGIIFGETSGLPTLMCGVATAAPRRDQGYIDLSHRVFVRLGSKRRLVCSFLCLGRSFQLV